MPSKYTVQQGDCISSLAAKFGLPFQAIWDDPGNADLKQKRPDPNVLFPGDEVVIPDKRLQEENRPVDALHSFKKKDAPTHVKIRLLLDFEPRGGESYELQVAGRILKGATDGDGYFEEEIPPDAESGVLLVGTSPTVEVFQIGFGHLDPVDTDDGVRKRLEALGYDAETSVEGAVKAFQTKQNMDANGTVDDALRAKLKEVFGQ